MYKVDLAEVIKRHNVDKDALAAALFPDHDAGYNALWRLYSDKTTATMSTDQVSTVAAYLGVHPGELYTIGPYTGSAGAGAVVIFMGGTFRAEFYPDEGVTLIHNTNTDFCKEIDTPAEKITLSEYLGVIAAEVENYRTTAG
jgi:hypothetical protein